jgi:hypothetical protein
MRPFSTLRKIPLILCFILAAFGCTTNKLVSSKNHVSDMNAGLKAKAVPEGICVSFENIPPEAISLFITVNKGLIYSPPASPYDENISFADIRDDSLEQVRKTGKVIFPYVQNGEIYRVFATFGKEGGQPIEGIPKWLTTECIAENGIYLDRSIELNLDNTQTGVTLSSEPEFSSEVVFYDYKYSYNVTIILKHTETEVLSMGGGDHATDLSWVFEPEFTDSLNEENALESGSYPAYVTAFCNIIYDNIKWFVEIAKTPVFTYSL